MREVVSAHERARNPGPGACRRGVRANGAGLDAAKRKVEAQYVLCGSGSAAAGRSAELQKALVGRGRGEGVWM